MLCWNKLSCHHDADDDDDDDYDYDVVHEDADDGDDDDADDGDDDDDGDDAEADAAYYIDDAADDELFLIFRGFVGPVVDLIWTAIFVVIYGGVL